MRNWCEMTRIHPRSGRLPASAGTLPCWRSLLVAAIALCLAMAPARLQAQSFDLTVRDYGIAFGDAPVVHGIRINAVDEELQRVDGLNLTFWRPGDVTRSQVNGIAIGLLPAAGTLRGIALGGLGASADRLQGIGIATLGIGGERLEGVALGLLGCGADVVRGVAIGGLGVGGEDIYGIALGGLGVGGQSMRGIAIGGLGVGGRSVRGIAVGGLGVGGEKVSGILIGGVGVGGEDVSGLCIGGIGVGGERVKGVVIGGLGAGAERLRGVAIGGIGVGAEEVRGLLIAPYCRVRGVHEGVAIGLVNIAHELHGVQLGLFNYAGNNSGWRRLLPVVNFHRGA